MEHHVKAAKFMARLLDRQFNLLGFRFGLDPLIGLIPGAGDAIALILAGYIIWIAVQLKLPQPTINRMLANVALDFVVGLVPVVGDIADFAFQANSRNLALIQTHLNPKRGLIE